MHSIIIIIALFVVIVPLGKFLLLEESVAELHVVIRTWHLNVIHVDVCLHVSDTEICRLFVQCLGDLDLGDVHVAIRGESSEGLFDVSL